MASLISKASLLMVPSVYEDGTLYNVLPSGNKAPDETGSHNGYDQTRADFTFSRGSNLAATRVNSDGLIEKGRENLLLQSNQFDTTWGDDGGTIASGFEGYDGTNNAWKYTKTGQFDGINQSGLSITGVHTISVYAKLPDGETDVDSLLFRIDYSGGNTNIVFALDDDSVPTASGNGIHAEKESVGNGWYRCSLTLNQSTTKVNFRPSLGSSTSGTSGSIFIQDAQAEKGLIASDVITTGATTATAGILEDMPRINYDANGENGALLLEPSRTNAYLHSDYLYNFNGTETFNHAISPEGVQNATLLTKTSASDQFLNMSWSGTTISASSDYTMSIFVKHNGDDVDVRYEYNNSNDWGAVAWTALFEVRTSGVTASTLGNCTSDVEDYGSGWYRLKVFVTSGASITASSPSNLFRVKGASGETILVYGAQMEKGSYESSLIPTHGAAVTRSDDFMNISSLADEIDGNSFTYFLEVNNEAVVRDASTGNISVGATGNRFFLYNSNATSNRLQLFIQDSGGIEQYVLSADNVKIAIRFEPNNVEVFENGVSVLSTTQNLDFSANSAYVLRGTTREIGIKQTAIFPTALTDSECISLTS